MDRFPRHQDADGLRFLAAQPDPVPSTGSASAWNLPHRPPTAW